MEQTHEKNNKRKPEYRSSSHMILLEYDVLKNSPISHCYEINQSRDGKCDETYHVS